MVRKPYFRAFAMAETKVRRQEALGNDVTNAALQFFFRKKGPKKSRSPPGKEPMVDLVSGIEPTTSGR